MVGRTLGRSHHRHRAGLDRAVELGLASTDDLDEHGRRMARRGPQAPDGWFAVLHGEVLATP